MEVAETGSICRLCQPTGGHLTHAARGNATGAVRLVERGVGRLTAYAGGPGPTYGLDLGEVTDCARRRIEGA